MRLKFDLGRDLDMLQAKYEILEQRYKSLQREKNSLRDHVMSLTKTLKTTKSAAYTGVSGASSYKASASSYKANDAEAIGIVAAIEDKVVAAIEDKFEGETSTREGGIGGGIGLPSLAGLALPGSTTTAAGNNINKQMVPFSLAGAPRQAVGQIGAGGFPFDISEYGVLQKLSPDLWFWGLPNFFHLFEHTTSFQVIRSPLFRVTDTISLQIECNLKVSAVPSVSNMMETMNNNNNKNNINNINNQNNSNCCEFFVRIHQNKKKSPTDDENEKNNANANDKMMIKDGNADDKKMIKDKDDKKNQVNKDIKDSTADNFLKQHYPSVNNNISALSLSSPRVSLHLSIVPPPSSLSPDNSNINNDNNDKNNSSLSPSSRLKSSSGMNNRSNNNRNSSFNTVDKKRVYIHAPLHPQETRPRVPQQDILEAVDVRSGTLSLEIKFIECNNDKITGGGNYSNKILYTLHNWGVKLNNYQVGTSLGKSPLFRVGKIENLQLEFFPFGDDSDQQVEQYMAAAAAAAASSSSSSSNLKNLKLSNSDDKSKAGALALCNYTNSNFSTATTTTGNTMNLMKKDNYLDSTLSMMKSDGRGCAIYVYVPLLVHFSYVISVEGIPGQQRGEAKGSLANVRIMKHRFSKMPPLASTVRIFLQVLG